MVKQILEDLLMTKVKSKLLLISMKLYKRYSPIWQLKVDYDFCLVYLTKFHVSNKDFYLFPMYSCVKIAADLIIAIYSISTYLCKDIYRSYNRQNTCLPPY